MVVLEMLHAVDTFFYDGPGFAFVGLIFSVLVYKALNA